MPQPKRVVLNVKRGQTNCRSDSTCTTRESDMEQPHTPLSLAHHRIFGRVHVVLLAADIPSDHPDAQYAYFDLSEYKCHPRQEIDHAKCPVSILMLHNFSQKLDELIQRNPHRSTALCVVPSVEAETIAALLLGTYMIMRFELSPDDAMKRLELMNIAPLPDELLAVSCLGEYSRTQDELCKKSAGPVVCNGQPLRVKDCLEAMRLAKNLRWIDLSNQQSDDNQQGPVLGFDAEEYEFLSNPLNADLTEVSSERRRYDQS
jgi:hypothetical protein